MKRYIAGLLAFAVALAAGLSLTGWGQEQTALTNEKFTEDNQGNTSYQYLINKDNTSLVYTSMGKEKGKYSKKVKNLFSGLLERLESR
ncbi:hypothetical protein [Paenibacillus sp. HW567]|uniref:hypothetical protein n=1 Tax=Paenibacillus sp. HW567 TaxID=1034769 RepID=UPI0003655B9F|nr:hypothetical protein [Paenibacillus sp. HW567]